MLAKIDVMKFWEDKLLSLVNPDELDEIINKLDKPQPMDYDHWKGLKDYPPDSHCGKCMLYKYYHIWFLIKAIFDETDFDNGNREYIIQTVEFLLNEWYIICYG